MKGAGVAVVITSVVESATPEDNGMVTGKIFEAIGLGTPTLLIAPAGSDANVVAETTGLARSFTAEMQTASRLSSGIDERAAP